MRRTLKMLSLIGVTAAAGAAALRRVLHPAEPVRNIEPLPSSVSQELRQALNRFQERFGA